MPNKRWKLCVAHKNCSTCKKAISTWEEKARVHSWNAQRLKYALMCVLNNETEELYNYFDYDDIDDLPLLLPAITIDTTEPNEEGKDQLNFSCGICYEKCCSVGKNQPIIFNCSHSICSSCYNNETFRKKKECPFCRGEIKKAIKIIIHTDEE